MIERGVDGWFPTRAFFFCTWATERRCVLYRQGVEDVFPRRLPWCLCCFFVLPNQKGHLYDIETNYKSGRVDVFRMIMIVRTYEPRKWIHNFHSFLSATIWEQAYNLTWVLDTFWVLSGFLLPHPSYREKIPVRTHSREKICANVVLPRYKICTHTQLDGSSFFQLAHAAKDLPSVEQVASTSPR